jgi:undecaprenyl-phosphate 4-deoxy-4-formamido-L-arabinose transferase
MDDDLEHPPEHIERLLEKGRQGFDLVYARFETRTHAAWRNLTSALVRRLFKLAIPTYYDYTSFRLIRGPIAERLTEFDSAYPFIDGYLSWVTNNCATVDVPHGARAEGMSTYDWRKLLVFAINIFVTFSDLPLRLATWLGLATFLGGMVWLGAIVLMKLLGGISVSGFASVMAGIILFGGLQLLILGIFGEYIGRMNFKSSRKPLFVVGRSVNLDSH